MIPAQPPSISSPVVGSDGHDGSVGSAGSNGGTAASAASTASTASAAVPAIRLCPKVVLVGPPGAGKSTIGRRLARALNLPLVDSDQLIAHDRGLSCGEVFQELGEPAFRELEATFVAQALAHRGVVSLGGGAVLHPITRQLLAEHDVVWIDVSVEEGVRRTAHETSRPVLAAKDPAAHYRALVEARAPLYHEVAGYRVRTDGRTPQQVVADILGYLDTL